MKSNFFLNEAREYEASRYRLRLKANCTIEELDDVLLKLESLTTSNWRRVHAWIDYKLSQGVKLKDIELW